LESQLYKDTERHFEQEIQRIEEATRKHQSRLDDIQAGIEREIHSELESRREELESRREKHEENGLDLERRYLKRRQEITDEQANTDREIKLRQRVGRTEEDIRREFGTEEEQIDYDQGIVSRQEGYVVNDLQSESRFADSFEGETVSIEQEFGKLEKIERNKFEPLRKGIQSKIEGYRGLKAEVEDGIRSEYERESQQKIERINNRDVQPADELSERIKSILELRGVLDKYNDVQATLERYRKGRSIIKNGTYKEWDK